MSTFGPSGTVRSTLSKDFSRVKNPSMNKQRSTFQQNHGYKTTMNSGDLVPVFAQEVLPGDTHTLNMTGFGRLNTPIFPTMDNLHMSSYFFWIPMRLVWGNTDRFFGERRPNIDSSIDYTCPQIVDATIANGTLFDYFGIPTSTANPISFNNFFGRCYNLCWNEWFRDQNLQSQVVVGDATDGIDSDGPDDIADYVILKKNKKHDLFTSALPWPQKGDDVLLPISGNAPIATTASGGDSEPVTVNDASGDPWRLGTNVTTAYLYDQTTQYPLYADLTDVSSATINELREAFTVQQFLEIQARSGSRYIEVVYSMFGVESDDLRITRTEYLGGSSKEVHINPVGQTSSTDATTPQGNLAGYGTIQFNNHRFSKSFTEHGFIIGLVCLYADLTYQTSLAKMWSRRTVYDFYFPVFANLGEQAILNQEIYCDGSASDTNLFGYQEAWYEYRYKPSMITGQFRSNYAQTLDSWHLAQDFGSLPSLNSSFITEDVPVDRIVAVPTAPNMILDLYFNYKSTRPMPVYSIPGLKRL